MMCKEVSKQSVWDFIKTLSSLFFQIRRVWGGSHCLWLPFHSITGTDSEVVEVKAPLSFSVGSFSHTVPRWTKLLYRHTVSVVLADSQELLGTTFKLWGGSVRFWQLHGHFGPYLGWFR